MNTETTITFYLSHDLKKAIQHMAIDQGISMSELLRAMLKDELDNFYDVHNDGDQATWPEDAS